MTKRLLLLTALKSLLFTLLFASPELFARAPQANDSSKSDETQIKKIEASGGRVYRISAADSSREISFNLSSTPVSDDHLNGINSIGEVIWLNLAGTKITDAGLKHLEGMPLKKLHLERTAIGDAGMEHLKSFTELEYLNIYDTQVSNAAIKHLKALKSLKKLYVWKSKINAAGIERLKKLLPDAEIVGELKLEPVVIEEPKKEKPKPKTEKAKAEQPKNEKAEKKDGAKKEAAKTEKPSDKKK